MEIWLWPLVTKILIVPIDICNIIGRGLSARFYLEVNLVLVFFLGNLGGVVFWMGILVDFKYYEINLDVTG